MRTLPTALAAILLVGLAVVGAAPSAAAADNGNLRMEADVTYELEPDESRVRVTVEMRLTNLIADYVRSDGATVFTVYESVNIPVPAEATNVAARRVGGGALTTFRDEMEDPQWALLGVDLSPDLRAGSPQTIEVDYDLPDQPPRSDGLVRASPAYTLFPVYPVGDLEHAGVTVIAPDVFDELEVVGSDMSRSVSDGYVTYTDDDIEEQFYATLAARNDDLLDEREVAAGDHTFTLRYTPGDEEWADFAEDVVSQGVPLLEDAIGEPWPGDDGMAIIESSSPHAFGYGGWFDLDANTIEVSDQLDAGIMLHELAHAWFNHDTLGERWLREGLADLYADQAGHEMTGWESEVEPGPSDADETIALAEWDESAVGFGGVEDFGYDTSWWAMDRIHDDIGGDAMSEVLAAAFDKKMPYASADGRREELSGPVGWRRMLDLLEEIGASDVAREVYEDVVLDEEGLDRLAGRDAARAEYEDLVDRSGGWGAPYEVRRAMSTWTFARLDELVAESEQVLGARDDVLDALAHLGVDELPELENEYQAADRIDETLDLGRQYTETADVVLTAEERPGGVLGALTWVGEQIVPADVTAGDAAVQVSEGDLEEARATAAAINEYVDRAPMFGGIVLGQALLCLMLLPWIVVRMRRRRHSDVPAEPVDDGVVTTVPAS